MSNESTYRILIGGGGTGGHVFPAIAIADALREKLPRARFLFVGALGRLEMEKVPEAGYEILGLPVAGFQRRVTLRNLAFVYKLGVSMIRSRRIVKQFKPDVALGVGGYASGPILRAAAAKRVPIVLQEQNSYAGVTNRLLARPARIICVAYEHMDRYFPGAKLVLTGNPVRKNLLKLPGKPAASRKAFGLDPDRMTCLVMGGSLGALTLNRSIADGLRKLDRDDLQVLWQCGKLYHREAEAIIEGSGMENVRVVPFISDMGRAYDAADVIVSRAGAITISELSVVGRPVVLVPSPNVAEDHQTRNAEALVSRRAAIMVPDRLAREHLVDKILELLEDRDGQKQLGKNIRKMAIPDSADRIADEILKILKTT